MVIRLQGVRLAKIVGIVPGFEKTSLRLGARVELKTGRTYIRFVLEYRPSAEMGLLSYFIDPDAGIGEIGRGAIDRCRVLPVFGKMVFIAEPGGEILLEDGGLSLYCAELGPGRGSCRARVLDILSEGQGAGGLVVQIAI